MRNPFWEGRRAIAAVAALAIAAGCGGGGGTKNAAPTFGAMQFSLDEDGELRAQLTASDPEGDALTFSRVSDPARGAVTEFTSAGTFTYRPRADEFGSDSFEVRVADSRGNSVAGTVRIVIHGVDDPVEARDDAMRVEESELASVRVLANDYNPDGDAVTVTVEEPALIGVASVNTDGSIRMSSLPAGFRGLTRFKYRLTEANGSSTVATSTLFVGIDPFRVAFVGNEPAQGAPEVYLTDLVRPPVRMTYATETDLRLRGFVPSENGAVVLYDRSSWVSTESVDLSIVRTAAPASPSRVPLPEGQQLLSYFNRQIPYAVSPDGQWAAASLDGPLGPAIVLFSIAAPEVLYTPSPPDLERAGGVQFSPDSRRLYFIAANAFHGSSLYRTAVSDPASSVRLSAAPVFNGEDIDTFVLTRDPSRVVFTRQDGFDIAGVYYVDPARPGEETQLNHSLQPGEYIQSTTAWQLGDTIGGSTDGMHVAYTIGANSGRWETYVADIARAPNPRKLALVDGQVVSFKRDHTSILYSTMVGDAWYVFEASTDGTGAPILVGEGLGGMYDASGNAVLMQRLHRPPDDPMNAYQTLTAATRPTFGVAHQVGTPGSFARFINFTASDRGMFIVGELPLGASPSLPVRMALASAWAPDKLIYLADFDSRLDLRSGRAFAVAPL